MSPNYNNPWREKEERKLKARRVCDYMAVRFKEQAADSVRRTIHYRISNCNKLFQLQKAPGAKLPDVGIIQAETVTASFIAASSHKGKIAILNFASYKNPGGMFLEGSIAQEESLCHASNLYNILSDERFAYEFYGPNGKRLNRGLYGDNLLYTPDVVFFMNKKDRMFDVITAAAPNKGVAQKYQNVSDQECSAAMRERIRHVLLAAINNNVDVLILGAFGCGVFKNDPHEVAEIFREELIGCPFTAIFAIPGEKYKIFRDVFSDGYTPVSAQNAL